VVTRTIRSHRAAFCCRAGRRAVEGNENNASPPRNADPTMLAPSSGDLRQERPHEVIDLVGFAVEKTRAAGKVANACYLGRIAVLARA
jgi:hypothetical protein